MTHRYHRIHMPAQDVPSDPIVVKIQESYQTLYVVVHVGVVEFWIDILQRFGGDAVLGKELEGCPGRLPKRWGVDPQTSQIAKDKASKLSSRSIYS